MIRKEITFDGIEGPITEEYYFSLTVAELMEEMLKAVGDVNGGDLKAQLQAVIASKDPKLIIATFKDIVLRSVGKRKGEKFLKTAEIREEFEGSGAYSELFFEMITNAGFASKFIEGMLPSNINERLAKVGEAGLVDLPQGEPEDTRPAWLREDRDPTDKELSKMSPEEMKLAFRRRMSQPQTR